MKRVYFPLIFLIFGLSAQAATEWRTFTSSDGERTFEGRLVAFDKKTDTVTVRTRNGQTLRFGQYLISKEDREYVEETAEKMPPDVRLKVRFEPLQDRTATNRKDRVRKITYDAGYKIILDNYTTQGFGDVEVEYLLIYRKGKVDGTGTDNVIHGRATTSLVANRRQEVETQTVELVSFFERGEVTTTTSGGSCRGGGCSSSRTNATPSKRSRDFLVGCIARVKVNGHIVNTTASAPNIERDYADRFDSAGEDYSQ